MALDMKEALLNAGIDMTTAELEEEEQARQLKQRSKTVVERPVDKVTLSRANVEGLVPKKYQTDPTVDLIFLRNNGDYDYITGLVNDKFYALVWCSDTSQMWLCPTGLCLDQNFIYRGDLDITYDKDDAVRLYLERVEKIDAGIIPRLSCYILDSPADERYEVYYDSSYPTLKYGKATPNGMFIYRCRNRFERDMKIMELDAMYTESSRETAAKLTSKGMGIDEAIIISDGCFANNACACAYYYLDNETLIKMAQGIVPSESEQAVLISEIVGATSALQMCIARGRKKITYYYDNTSIFNVLRNRRTEYIREIVEYKSVLEDMDNAGFEVKFAELHPKTGTDRSNTNKALMFFHNYCDKECTEMAQIFSKDYRSFAQTDSPSVKTYKQAKQEFKPKGVPRKSTNNVGVKSNQRTGNNRYGRR